MTPSMFRTLLITTAILTPLTASATNLPTLPSLSSILKQVSKDPLNVIAQVKSMDWYATQPICPKDGPASACPIGSSPGDPIDPYFHQCAPAAIRFVQEMPSLTVTPPLPAGMANGPFVLFEKVRVETIALNTYTNEIATRGFPAYLTLACAAYFQDSRQLPFKVATDFNTNFLSFLSNFFHGATGL